MASKRPISVSRKHREPSSYFESNPEEEVYHRRDVSKEVKRPDNVKDQGRKTKEKIVKSTILNLK